MDILICPICKNDYDLVEHVPKLLECNNTLCLKCLNQVKKLRLRSKFKCVFDREHKHKYPKKKQTFADIVPDAKITILFIKFKEYNEKLDEFENILKNFDELSQNQLHVLARSKELPNRTDPKCSKCQQEFNTTDRVPRYLDSKRKICSHCIQDMAKELNVIVKECKNSFQTINA